VLFFHKRNNKNDSVVPSKKETIEKCKCCSFGKKEQQNCEEVVPSERNNKNDGTVDPSKRNRKMHLQRCCSLKKEQQGGENVVSS